MADAAGLLNPKLKPVVDADVVAGVPVLKKKKKSDFTITVYTHYSSQSGTLKICDPTSCR